MPILFLSAADRPEGQRAVASLGVDGLIAAASSPRFLTPFFISIATLW